MRLDSKAHRSTIKSGRGKVVERETRHHTRARCAENPSGRLDRASADQEKLFEVSRRASTIVPPASSSRLLRPGARSETDDHLQRRRVAGSVEAPIEDLCTPIEPRG